jgi:hypothetical protein
MSLLLSPSRPPAQAHLPALRAQEGIAGSAAHQVSMNEGQRDCALTDRGGQRLTEPRRTSPAANTPGVMARASQPVPWKKRSPPVPLTASALRALRLPRGNHSLRSASGGAWRLSPASASGPSGGASPPLATPTMAGRSRRS